MQDAWGKRQWTTLIPRQRTDLSCIPDDPTPPVQGALHGDIAQQPPQEMMPMPMPMSPVLVGPTASTSMAQPLRKSCDFCRARKKKCDGPMASDGFGRCRFCASKGLEECVYSERKSSAPKTRPSKRPKEGDISGADGGGDRGVSPGLPSAMVSLEAFEGVPVKRCRLSASPATGLVGMQENVFLSHYFECMGLLPLTDESEIRSAMVAMMRSVLPPEQRGLHSSIQPSCIRKTALPGGTFARNGSQSSLPPAAGAGTVATAAAAAAAAAASAGAAAAARARRLRSDVGASTCALWCAVAMGALVQGWPTSSVAGYVELAREALKECFDEASVGAMRAFTLMAFVSNFMGEPDKFQKYLMFAHSMHRSLPPQEVSKDAVDMLLTADSALLYNGATRTIEEMDDFCQIDDSTAKVAGSMAQKSDRCRLLINIDHRLDQAFFKDMTEQGVLSRPLPGDPLEGFDESRREFGRPPPPAETRDDSLTVAVGGGGAEDARKVQRRRGGCERNSLLTLVVVEGEDPETPPLGEITQRRVLDELPELERLAADVSWPEIKSGVGGLIFNVRMCLLHYLRNDIDKAHHVMRIVVDIFLQWPGLCRFSPWLHITHLALGSLAKDNSRLKYEQLRATYNPVRPASVPEAPPLDEWKGIGCICQHVFCR